MPEPRRGWPLPYIPAGKANWVAFVRRATPEQLEQVCLTFAYQALLDGRVTDATEALAVLLDDRARRGVGGVPQ